MIQLHEKYIKYRYCIVRECKNTSIKTPTKLFVPVPTKINARNTWLRLANRDPASLSTKGQIHLCEDHFDLEKDMENYIGYKVMGFVKKIHMNPGCLPSRFDFQADTKRNQKTILAGLKQTSKKTSVTSPDNEESCADEMSTSIFHHGTEVSSLKTKNEQMSVESVAVKEEVGDENIIVVKHEVEDYSLESIEFMQPENRVLHLNNKPETEKKSIRCDKLKTKSEMDVKIIDLKNDSVPSTSHSGVTNFNITEKMYADHTSIEADVKSCDIGEDFTDVGESITVVKHEVEDYSLESIELMQPENRVLHLNNNPETEKKYMSCSNLTTQSGMDAIIDLKKESVESVAIKEEVESSDFSEDFSAANESITVVKHEIEDYFLESENMYADHDAVKADVESIYIYENFTHIDESITVVKHEVEDYSLEMFEAVQPVNKVIYSNKEPSAGTKLSSCDELNADMVIDNGQYKYQCEHCDKCFKNRSYLLKHLRGHKMQYRCEICDQRFKERRFLKVHMVKHTGEQPHQCDICQKKFALSSSLFKHRKIHSGDKNFECEYCQRHFARKDQLNEHRRIHSETKDFECEYCKKRFSHRSTLYEHRQLHSSTEGDKKFECEHCKKLFSNKKSINIHLKIHSGVKNHECKYCKKRFIQKQALDEHLKRHSGIKDFECGHCKKRFALKRNLKEHLKLHIGTKDFECEHCKMFFVNKRYLMKHMSVHTQERPFSCNICEKTFKWKFEVKKHIMKTHKDVDITKVVIEPHDASNVVVNIQ